MKKIAIFAPTGMLGSMVYNVLKEKYQLTLIYRDKNKLSILDKTYGSVSNHKTIQVDLAQLFINHEIDESINNLFEKIGQVDLVINCAGIIKPHSLKNPILTFYINSVFPHILSKQYKEKLIQITTDCAFDGITGAPYYENSIKNAKDLYGISKFLGEPSENSLVLRTSIIGPEITEFVSLIEWFKKQSGKTIQGFASHFWNGITTKEFGKICDKIISNRNKYPEFGLFHIFSTDITKYEMLLAFREKFNIDVNIEKKSPPSIDRRLRTNFEVCKMLNIPSFQNMLNEL